jgi:hypothetical protein
MKWIDIPPVWLLAAVIATWFIGQAQPFGLSLDFPITQLLGGLLVGAGIILMALAAMEMRKQRTTIVPTRRQTAS